MYRQIPSARLERAVEELSKLPGIGGRTAMRLALFLLKQDDAFVASFVSAISDMKKNVKYCKVCNNISDTDICSICSDKGRDGALICVVENIKDVMSIEATMQYNGLYHVLGGLISPMDGIGPSDIAIDTAMMTILASDLMKVPQAIRLSRLTIRTIRQNLFWAFIYNLITVPIAAGILYPVNGFLLNPMIGGAAMALSSVSVISNSLRLRRKSLEDNKLKP